MISKHELIGASDVANCTILGNVSEKYEFIKVLGHGGYGIVRQAKKVDADEDVYYAIKSISKEKMQNKLHQLKKELEVLQTLKHPNILQIYEVWEDSKYLHVVSEELTGGDLFGKLMEVKRFSEADSARICRQLFSAINYMHEMNIAHRDIKPENILFKDSYEEHVVKVIDFGLATKFDSLTTLETRVGSTYYVAPEVLRGSYNQLCDVWSLGTVLYTMLAGFPPFFASDNKTIYSMILNAEYSFTCEPWPSYSQEVQDLISRMLVIRPELRISLNLAIDHEWFTKASDAPKLEEKVDEIIPVIRRLHKYSVPKKFKQMATQIALNHLTADRYKNLQDAFELLDTNHTGIITAQSLQQALLAAGLSTASEEVAAMLKSKSYMADASLNYLEFLAATVDLKSQLTDQVLFETFSQFDTDGTGEITIASFIEAMRRVGNYMTEEEARKVISEYSSTIGLNDDKINFAQFKQIMIEEGTPRDEGSATPYPRALDFIPTPNLRNNPEEPSRDFASFTTAMQTAEIPVQKAS